MKPCPRCAEQVQPAARICRWCGYAFTEDETRAAERDATFSRVGKALPGVLLLVFIVWTCNGVDKEVAHDRAREVAAAQASIMDPKPCAAQLRKEQRSGLIRAWPRGDEIQVDEWRWVEMPADAKRATMMALRCHALGGRADDSEIGMFVRAYGWRSGRELASASRYGVTLE